MTGGDFAERPSRAWRPGTQPGPDRGWLAAAKRKLDRASLIGKGVALVREGYFWEAHELLEQAWLSSPANSAERDLLRAVVQIANGLLKLRMGRPRAANRLLAEAHVLLAGIAGHGPIHGLDPSRLAVLAGAVKRETGCFMNEACDALQRL